MGQRVEPGYSGEGRHVAFDNTVSRTTPPCPLTQDPSVRSYPLRSDAGLTLNLRSVISWGAWLAGGGDLLPAHSECISTPPWYTALSSPRHWILAASKIFLWIGDCFSSEYPPKF